MNELSTLPPYDANRFMRWLAKTTEAYFENSENQKRFEEWRKKRRESETMSNGRMESVQ